MKPQYPIKVSAGPNSTSLIQRAKMPNPCSFQGPVKFFIYAEATSRCPLFVDVLSDPGNQYITSLSDIIILIN
jgi:hypothetical protein